MVRGGEGSNVGADVGESAVELVVADLSCDSPSVFFPRASSLRLPFARRPGCSPPASLLSTVGDGSAGTASVVFIAATGRRCFSTAAVGFLESKSCILAYALLLVQVREG